MTDPIADMLTRMRNALAAKHQKVDVPASKLKLELARILKEEGYITGYKTVGEGVRLTLRIYLRYSAKGDPIVSKLERVSKPGCRVYSGNKQLVKVLGGLGINILSTSKGLMTDKQARRDNVGGEVLCRVY